MVCSLVVDLFHACGQYTEHFTLLVQFLTAAAFTMPFNALAEWMEQ